MSDQAKNIATAVSLLADLTTAGLHASVAFGAVSALLLKAHAAGRDITDEELSQAAGTDDVARARLQKAIDGA
jgi:hypothetical protein